MPPVDPAPSSTTDEPRFSDVLASAIGRQGLTLDELSRRLQGAGTPVAQATLSYWQRGRCTPSGEASLQSVRELERILRLPVGHLVSCLPAETRGGSPLPQPPAHLAGLLADPDGLPLLGSVCYEYVHDACTAQQQGQRLHSRDLLRCEADGVRHSPVLVQCERDGSLPQVRPGADCTVEEVRHLPGLAMAVVVVRHARPMRRGDRFLREVTTTHLGEPDGPALQRLLPERVPFVVFEADFPSAPPASVTYSTSPHQWLPRDPGTVLRQELAPGRHVQVCLADPPPGWHALGWQGAPVTPRPGEAA